MHEGAAMRESISKVSLVVYAFLLFFSSLVMAAAGARVGLFCIMGAFAVPPIVAGPKRYRIIGVIALTVAIALTAIDYHEGKRLRKRIDEIRQRRDMKDVSILSMDGVEGVKVGGSCYYSTLVGSEEKGEGMGRSTHGYV
jgi:hypothetical protein